MILDVIGMGMKLIDKLIPDKEARAAATLKLMELEQAGDLKELDAAMQIIVAEAKSEHPLTSQWRPIVMLMFAAIIANNYLVYPYLSLFWPDAPVLPLPPDLWALMKIGIGGYVVSRGAEKVAKELK